MKCDECEKCKALGYKFCNKCGADLSDNEDDSQEPVVVEKSSELESLLKKSVIPAMFLVFITLVIDVALILVYIGPTLEWVADYSTSLYIYFIDFFKFATLEGTAIQLYMIILAIILMFCVGIILYKSKDALLVNKPYYVERIRETPLYWLSMVFGSTLVLELIIVLLMNALGVSTPTPSPLIDLTPEKALFLFSEAAVYEEVTFRVILFGVPMAAIALICGRKDFYRYLMGGFGASKIAMVFLVISTILFAYAHVGGWGAWKMIPVMLGGFAMGFLFMKYGLYAAIIFHMANDFMAVWLPTIPELGSILEILIILMGILCLPILFKSTWQGLKGIKDLPLGFEKNQEESNDSNLD